MNQVKKELKKEKSKLDNGKPPTRVLIRHLPPTMSEEEFLVQVGPIPDFDEFYFVDADWSLGYDATCRAYIDFKNYDDVYSFRDRFDGYIFIDSKGFEYKAVVEFAPFQGFTDFRTRVKECFVDTIEEIDHYKQFISKFTEEKENADKMIEGKPEFNMETRKKCNEVTTTPLLEYLATKKNQHGEECDQRHVKDKTVWTKPRNKTDLSFNSFTSSRSDGSSNHSRRSNRSQRRREEYLKKRFERQKQRQNQLISGIGCEVNFGENNEDAIKNKEESKLADLKNSSQKPDQAESKVKGGGGGDSDNAGKTNQVSSGGSDHNINSNPGSKASEVTSAGNVSHSGSGDAGCSARNTVNEPVKSSSSKSFRNNSAEASQNALLANGTTKGNNIPGSNNSKEPNRVVVASSLNKISVNSAYNREGSIPHSNRDKVRDSHLNKNFHYDRKIAESTSLNIETSVVARNPDFEDERFGVNRRHRVRHRKRGKKSSTVDNTPKIILKKTDVALAESILPKLIIPAKNLDPLKEKQSSDGNKGEEKVQELMGKSEETSTQKKESNSQARRNRRKNRRPSVSAQNVKNQEGTTQGNPKEHLSRSDKCNNSSSQSNDEKPKKILRYSEKRILIQAERLAERAKTEGNLQLKSLDSKKTSSSMTALGRLESPKECDRNCSKHSFSNVAINNAKLTTSKTCFDNEKPSTSKAALKNLKDLEKNPESSQPVKNSKYPKTNSTSERVEHDYPYASKELLGGIGKSLSTKEAGSTGKAMA